MRQTSEELMELLVWSVLDSSRVYNKLTSTHYDKSPKDISTQERNEYFKEQLEVEMMKVN